MRTNRNCTLTDFHLRRQMRQSTVFRSFFPLNVFIVLLFLSAACTPGACYEDTDVFMKAFFYREGIGKQAPDTLSIKGKDMNDFIYENKTKVQPAILPLDAANEQCSFYISINNTADTLTVSYTNRPHLISKECGYVFYHYIDSVLYTTHIIDTITILNKKVTTVNEENIRIYFN